MRPPGEGVHALVLPPGLEVKPQLPEQLDGEAPLGVGVEAHAAEDVWVGGRAGERFHQGDELVAQRMQHRHEPDGAHSGLEAVEQRVVALPVVANGVGLLAAQLE